MCYHKLYVFLSCGHAISGALLRPCGPYAGALSELLQHEQGEEHGQVTFNELRLRQIARHVHFATPCPDPEFHAFQTVKFYSPCLRCIRERAERVMLWEKDNAIEEERRIRAERRKEKKQREMEMERELKEKETLTWENTPWLERFDMHGMAIEEDGEGASAYSASGLRTEHDRHHDTRRALSQASKPIATLMGLGIDKGDSCDPHQEETDGSSESRPQQSRDAFDNLARQYKDIGERERPYE